jgi:amidohydrolase
VTAERISATLETRREALIEMRRDIHRHPEVAGEERRTAGLVAKRLRELGLEVQEGVGGHGVVAVLRGESDGPVVAFRADMDAVADPSPDPVSFASETQGVRHICGHDIHTTIGVGIAEALAPLRGELSGTVKLIFQPAEENATGARAMLEDGAMKDPKPLAIFAVHTYPMEVGMMGAGIGPVLAGRDLAIVTLTGKGDLGAAATGVREVVSGITSLDIEQAAAGQMVEGEFMLGQTLQVQPGEEPNQRQVINQITVNSPAMRKQAFDKIRTGLQSLDLGDVTYELDYRERYTSGVDNDERLIERARKIIAPLLGEESFQVTRGTIPFFSEDFGFFQDEAPGVMFWLGVSNAEKGYVGLPHSPNSAADEESIFVGAKAMSLVLLDYLKTPPESHDSGQ